VTKRLQPGSLAVPLPAMSGFVAANVEMQFLDA
jgi:hypothetical protein